MAQRQAGAVSLPDFLKPRRADDGGYVIEARNIALSFGGIRAVRDVTLRIRDRALHALIGPNGAGKTTAFNLISGMFAPNQGSVLLAGTPIDGTGAGEDHARRHRPLVPDHQSLPLAERRGEPAPRAAGA